MKKACCPSTHLLILMSTGDRKVQADTPNSNSFDSSLDRSWKCLVVSTGLFLAEARNTCRVFITSFYYYYYYYPKAHWFIISLPLNDHPCLETVCEGSDQNREALGQPSAFPHPMLHLGFPS